LVGDDCFHPDQRLNVLNSVALARLAPEAAADLKTVPAPPQLARS
jgi:hypothetical protein